MKLSWSTSLEKNNSFFSIKRSRDGKKWEETGNVPASADGESESSYSFTDAHPGSGRIYYRLKQIDTDENFGYSRIIEVNISTELPVSLYGNIPNPVKYELPFTLISGSETGEVLILVTDLSGRKMVSVKEDFYPGINQYSVDVSGFESGVYFLKITSKNQIVALHKIIKV